MSALLLYLILPLPLNTSGAFVYGVPTWVTPNSPTLLKPKSAIFNIPSFTNMFFNFRSLWITNNSCSPLNPFNNYLRKFLAISSDKGFLFCALRDFIYESKSP